MKLASLFSGGKDSAYSAHLAMQQGHTISHLVTFQSENPTSYMFHHPNVWVTKLQAKSAGIPHLEFTTKGEKEKELADIESALSKLEVDGVVSGAVASVYQKERVDAICDKLGIKSIAPLWGRDQAEVAMEEAKTLDAIVVSVSADGLGKEWLGRKFDENCVNELVKLREKFRISVVGEGGEFDTLVLNAPFFTKKIKITDSEINWQGTMGTFNVKSASLV